jgi:methylated-DNA-[protein]-cysteine S-methyltransferase
MKDDNKKNIVRIDTCELPCGTMLLGAIDDHLCLCDWHNQPCAERNKRRLARLLNAEFREETSDVLQQTKAELQEYFEGKRKTFDIPLHPVGTDFQKSVWDALRQIPYGETRTYKDIALQVDNLKGIRAVAQAIGANGISIIIPCHRVIGSDHSLTGFAGGLNAKRILLELESAQSIPH